MRVCVRERADLECGACECVWSISRGVSSICLCVQRACVYEACVMSIIPACDLSMHLLHTHTHEKTSVFVCACMLIRARFLTPKNMRTPLAAWLARPFTYVIILIII